MRVRGTSSMSHMEARTLVRGHVCSSQPKLAPDFGSDLEITVPLRLFFDVLHTRATIYLHCQRSAYQIVKFSGQSECPT